MSSPQELLAARLAAEQSTALTLERLERGLAVLLSGQSRLLELLEAAATARESGGGASDAMQGLAAALFGAFEGSVWDVASLNARASERDQAALELDAAVRLVHRRAGRASGPAGQARSLGRFIARHAQEGRPFVSDEGIEVARVGMQGGAVLYRCARVS